jgi:glutathione S-transferase
VPSVYHIPVCPFSQRLEILLSLKGRRSDVEFNVVDITQPRPAWLLAKTRGTTALPVMEMAAGQILKESLVILQYLETSIPSEPWPSAIRTAGLWRTCWRAWKESSPLRGTRS